MKTQELRWFSTNKLNSLEQTFAQELNAYIIEDNRVDTYLLTSCSDVNIKRRDNLVDIKKRTSAPRSRIKIGKSSGYLESWVKWQFESEIDLHTNNHWFNVEKSRKLIYFNEEGQLTSLINGKKPAAMQIEYTTLKIEGRTHYSFAVEWTVEKTETHCDILTNLLKGHELILRQSMGYPEYLSLLINSPLELHEV